MRFPFAFFLRHGSGEKIPVASLYSDLGVAKPRYAGLPISRMLETKNAFSWTMLEFWEGRCMGP